MRWHSFQETKHRPNSMAGQTVGSLTVGQLLVLRKLALLKLTAIMERHCPTHRTGWNWELPKFMRKTRVPDPKGMLYCYVRGGRTKRGDVSGVLCDKRIPTRPNGKFAQGCSETDGAVCGFGASGSCRENGTELECCGNEKFIGATRGVLGAL